MNFHSLLRKGARSLGIFLPSLRRLYSERNSLRQRLKEIEEKHSTLLQDFSQLRHKYSSITSWGMPNYDADYLRVWNKNTDFLQDEEFMRAYRAGVHSGHKIGGASRSSEDIHIEWRIVVCCWAAWHASKLEGDFVECGTNTGIMSLAICNYIDFNTTGKNFYLFDTYNGIPEDQLLPEERAAGRLEENSVYEECFEKAQKNFASFVGTRLVRGKVPDTLPTQKIEKVCYLMLDMNIMLPERAALEFFWEKLVPGAIVLFDDYGWTGYIAQKKAHDAFAASKGVKILNLPTGQGMLIKP